MALDPRLILAGQQFDLGGSMGAGIQNARHVQAFDQSHQAQQQQNALNQYIGQNAPQLMGGNVNALNGLAGLGAAGLEMAQGVQSHQQGVAATDLNMSATRQRMRILDDQQAAQVQAEAAKLSADQRAAAAQQAEGLAKQLLASASPEQWDQIAMQNNSPDMVGKFGERDIVAANFMDVADIMKMGQEPEPADEYGRYVREERAKGLEPLSRIDYAQAKKGVETVFGPDGNPILQRGPATAGNGKSLTVDEGKNTGFLIRAQDSIGILNGLESEGTSLGAKIANNVPLVGNYLQSPEYRQYDQARRDFINAVLRRESGAVISTEEFANAELQYFPQPGDDPETIAQKRQNRENAVKGFEIGAGDGVNRIEGQAAQMPPAPQGSGIPDEEWPAIWDRMSPEDRALFQ